MYISVASKFDKSHKYVLGRQGGGKVHYTIMGWRYGQCGRAINHYVRSGNSYDELKGGITCQVCLAGTGRYTR